MEVALYVCGACRAPRNLRLAQKEIKHRANAPGHDKANQHPESRTHAPSGRVLADVAHHEEVVRGYHSPGEIEVDAQAEWRHMVLLLGENNPEIVFDQYENDRSEEHTSELQSLRHLVCR